MPFAGANPRSTRPLSPLPGSSANFLIYAGSRSRRHVWELAGAEPCYPSRPSSLLACTRRSRSIAYHYNVGAKVLVGKPYSIPTQRKYTTLNCDCTLDTSQATGERIDLPFSPTQLLNLCHLMESYRSAPYISPDGSQIALADKAVLSLYDTVTGSMLRWAGKIFLGKRRPDRFPSP